MKGNDRTMNTPPGSRPRPLLRLLKRAAIVAILLVLGAGALLAALIAWPAPEPPDRSRGGGFVIRGVSVVDVETGKLLPGRDVVLRSGTIESVSPAGSGPIPGDVAEIDGRGRYLVPGLWDLHTHSNTFAPQFQHPLFVAHGVVAVREMWGCMSRPDPFIACVGDRQRWNEALENGTGVNPRYIGQSSYQINGKNRDTHNFCDFGNACTTRTETKSGGCPDSFFLPAKWQIA